MEVWSYSTILRVRSVCAGGGVFSLYISIPKIIIAARLKAIASSIWILGWNGRCCLEKTFHHLSVSLCCHCHSWDHACWKSPVWGPQRCSLTLTETPPCHSTPIEIRLKAALYCRLQNRLWCFSVAVCVCSAHNSFSGLQMCPQVQKDSWLTLE